MKPNLRRHLSRGSVCSKCQKELFPLLDLQSLRVKITLSTSSDCLDDIAIITVFL